jgi:N-glycosylase/DNA lyase
LTIPLKRNRPTVAVEHIRATHTQRKKEIRARLNEFRKVWRSGSDLQLWEELVYCIFTAGASARMGLKSVEAIRPLLIEGEAGEMTKALVAAGAHRFPVARPGYIVVTRNYLRTDCDMSLRRKLRSFTDPIERRDWLAQEKQVKGLGYKEASHYLRNIGLSGYAILDKHVMSCLMDLRVVDTAKPPATRARYLEVEQKLRLFARDIKIDFDELDLVLWSMKTGEVLK